MRSDPLIRSGKPQPTAHGGGVRGDNFTAQSRLFQGRFGRMFRALPAAKWPQPALQALAAAMTAEPERFKDNEKLPSAPSEDTPSRIQDAEENAGIAAGYTYFGQFIDHDITFDPASSLQKQNDPEALIDFRTPRLDLDSLYGRGPDDQPYLYDGKKFRLGRPLFRGSAASTARDLPRHAPEDAGPNPPAHSKRALIGDKRNDENVIIAQLHAAMLQFHNKLVDLPRNRDASFEAVQREVRWTYQWLVVHDFLPTVCGKDVVKAVAPPPKSGTIAPFKTEGHIYHYRDEPFLPIEFSAAVYRFGHSMVRPIYRLNGNLHGGDDPNAATPTEKKQGVDGRFFVFAGVHDRALNGFGEFPKEWAIDWSLFFDIGGSINNVGRSRVQPSYKIDTSLVNPLGFLPEFSETVAFRPPLDIAKMQGKPVDPQHSPANLALRNLLRGMSMGLPSGEAVARSLGVTPIAPADLRIGKATMEDMPGNKALRDIDSAFDDNTPLWVYVLAEAQHEWFKAARTGGGDAQPMTLGPVGGRLVAEVLIGLIAGDGESYLAQAPGWKPDRVRSIGDLLKIALG
jgi:hypothetical protein